MIRRYIQNLIQLTFAPSRGWEDLETAEVEDFRLYYHARTAEAEKKPSGEEAADAYASWLNDFSRRSFTRCFLPVIAVCSLSWFARLLYATDETAFASMADRALLALQYALVSFVGMLLAALLSQSIFLATLPRILNGSTVEWGAWKGRALNMIMYCITFLGTITLISNVVKVRVALLEFLPFYVVFIIWKGCRYIEVPQRNAGLFMIIASGCIIGLPYLLSFLLNAVANV